MKITVYPADNTGCGAFRMVWPSEELNRQGADIEIRPPGHRDIQLKICGRQDDPGAYVEDVVNVDSDVVVFQRVTHRYIAQAVPILRRKGIAVVIDVDDDLTSIHPNNPAYDGYHPKNEFRVSRFTGQFNRHSWRNLSEACRNATLVTVSTPALLGVYARHGRGRVVYNYLPGSYYGVPHQDSELIGWPAALRSHPDDPSALGGAVARLCDGVGGFQVIGDPTGCGAAFGLATDPLGHDPVGVDEWPSAVAEIGIGIAPLADTRFNRSKSWLKPLEMSALGVPWVASDSVEYSRLHRMGAGILARNPRQWFRALSGLRQSEDLRCDLAGQGYEVAEKLRLRDHAGEWLDAWTRAREIQSSSRSVAV